MKSYSSFLLRCWVIREEAEQGIAEKTGAGKIVFDIEQIQTGAHQRTTAPEEALQWILAACQNYQPEDLDAEPEEPDRQSLQAGKYQ
ncbi:MAG TPA: hypothetical protein VFZ34_06750 [Blastocatellia bacterium]|nr:hypothetical protein [Blastocatellia bacterium]